MKSLFIPERKRRRWFYLRCGWKGLQPKIEEAPAERKGISFSRDFLKNGLETVLGLKKRAIGRDRSSSSPNGKRTKKEEKREYNVG
ncbi:hypothetical protein ACD591_09360 [Rufibacter glacialis]|uniref:Uncharacterized protein n=1 Tax=Rufibacter glacialis TaxID=1259555 RepID=A0A5M8QB83_9BACT|nr:hypothetical protein [Rufibacter glacialis]KAA6432363.1 hypothetical protein FOE74_14755 [Rufibacter glacialis]